MQTIKISVGVGVLDELQERLNCTPGAVYEMLLERLKLKRTRRKRNPVKYETSLLLIIVLR
jgi:hypothetical protein